MGIHRLDDLGKIRPPNGAYNNAMPLDSLTFRDIKHFPFLLGGILRDGNFCKIIFVDFDIHRLFIAFYHFDCNFFFFGEF
jgi:hypothetical protein